MQKFKSWNDNDKIFGIGNSCWSIPSIINFYQLDKKYINFLLLPSSWVWKTKITNFSQIFGNGLMILIVSFFENKIIYTRCRKPPISDFFQLMSISDSERVLNLKMYLLITCVPFAMIYFTSLKGAYPVDIYFVILASEDWVVSEIENVLCVEKKLKNVFQVLNCLKNYLKSTPVNMKKDFTWNKNLKLTGIYFKIKNYFSLNCYFLLVI